MAFTGSNSTNFAAMLRVYYEKKKPASLVLEGRPGIAFCEKDTGWRGNGTFDIPLMYADVQSTSSSYTDMKDNRGKTTQTKFQLTRVRQYSGIQMDRETMLSADDDQFAFMKLVTSQTDSMHNAFGNALEQQFFGDRTGVIGQVTSAGSTTVTLGEEVTLSKASDIRNFDLGKRVNFIAKTTSLGYTEADADNATTGTTYYVTAVDRSNYKVTFNAVPANCDYDLIVGEGDAYADTDAAGQVAGWKKGAGLKSWLKNPADSDWATTFFGVDRSVDKQRLGGIFHDAAAASEDLEEALISAGAKAANVGAKPDIVYMNPLRVAELARILDGKIASTDGERTKVQSNDAQISFKSIGVWTGAGLLPVVAAPACDYNEAYMLQKNTWLLASVKECPMLLTDGGGSLHQDGVYDALTIDVGAYYNFACRAPGYNVRIKLA